MTQVAGIDLKGALTGLLLTEAGCEPAPVARRVRRASHARGSAEALCGSGG